MPKRPPIHRPIGSARAREQRLRQYNATPERRAHQQLYDYSWRLYSKRRLSLHPWCVECMKLGVLRRGTVTDHITDHDGDPVLFKDPDNHQTLCGPHHSSKTRREHAPSHSVKPAPRA